MYAKAKTYLVAITIIEGRHFAWPNMDSAVLVRVDNQKRCTKIVRSTDSPYFSEVDNPTGIFNTKIKSILVFPLRVPCKTRRTLG